MTQENGERKEKRTERAVIQLTPEEHTALTSRAEKDGLPLSTYVRRLILKDAEKKSEP